MTCNNCNGTGMAYRLEDKDPYEGYKLADKKPCLNCGGNNTTEVNKVIPHKKDYNDGNWHGWNGGECPVHPETVVDVALTDSKPCIDTAEQWFWCREKSRIIAFRVIKEHKDPREFWVFDGHSFENLKGAEQFANGAYGGKEHPEIIHVREVIEE